MLFRSLDDGVLLATRDQVRLVRSGGTEMDFPVSGVHSFTRMNEGYVQMVTSNGSWALRTEPDQEQVFLLPGGSQDE